LALARFEAGDTFTLPSELLVMRQNTHSRMRWRSRPRAYPLTLRRSTSW
jgi:hypothetical protein